MARFVNLDQEEDGEADRLPASEDVVHQLDKMSPQIRGKSIVTMPNETLDRIPEIPSAMAIAFRCYPIVVTISSFIDVNTLDALSRTSRIIHSSLLQFRTILLVSTLRCINEALPVDPEQTLRFRARAGTWEDILQMPARTGGKSGDCARDMVGCCRRCGDVVCRNCTIKPPPPRSLHERHRRLCKTCACAPMSLHASPKLHIDLPVSSDFVQQAVCRCERDGVWLCQPCGRGIWTSDNNYRNIWRWRSQYGEVLGGLGTGIGEGDRGVPCGRGEHCLAAKEHEQEVDCDAEDAKSSLLTASSLSLIDASGAGNNRSNSISGSLIAEASSQHARTSSPHLGPGYERHEIEGIGGVVKRKLLRRVKVGACVPEWEDDPGVIYKILQREVEGRVRSWCGWCWRLIPEDHV